MSSSRPRRGRPRSFDVDTATGEVERVLWSQGYRATSVEELADAAGLSVSSLYAAFGNKQGVLQAALARYTQEMAELLEMLEAGTKGLADVSTFLSRVAAALDSSDQPQGCFMVNTMIEVSHGLPEIAEITSTYRRRVEHSIAVALRRAANAGEIPAGTVADRARISQAALFGALTAARAGDSDAARSGIASLRRELRRW